MEDERVIWQKDGMVIVGPNTPFYKTLIMSNLQLWGQVPHNLSVDFVLFI